MARYAEITDMELCFDKRILGDLVQDVGTRVTDLTANSTLEAMLDQAAGIIDSASFVGGRYSSTDLDGLTGNSEAFIKRLNCTGAFILLKMRRNLEVANLPQKEEWDGSLSRLRTGERIFDIEDTKTAAHMGAVAISLIDIRNQRYLSDQLRMFFPRNVSVDQI